MLTLSAKPNIQLLLFNFLLIWKVWNCFKVLVDWSLIFKVYGNLFKNSWEAIGSKWGCFFLACFPLLLLQRSWCQTSLRLLNHMRPISLDTLDTQEMIMAICFVAEQEKSAWKTCIFYKQAGMLQAPKGQLWSKLRFLALFSKTW